LELVVEIQYPWEYPFGEPSFILHNERNYTLPRNVATFFAEQKFYGRGFSPAACLWNNFLPLIKEECERETDEDYGSGTRYYSPSCGAHRIMIHTPDKR
jgi:hypothetical protein